MVEIYFVILNLIQDPVTRFRITLVKLVASGMTGIDFYHLHLALL